MLPPPFGLSYTAFPILPFLALLPHSDFPIPLPPIQTFLYCFPHPAFPILLPILPFLALLSPLSLSYTSPLF